MRSPRFSYSWMAYNQGVLAAANSTGAQRAGARMFYVEAISEGARFHAISDRIEAALAPNIGRYHFDTLQAIANILRLAIKLGTK
ncbi:hypothetical protein [Streptomyces hokutonensis]|uniref:hypothetical protein n=1 Tax=Streptomyces hokutonensis TaxID=1306990 RepID=UPI00380C0E0E